MEESKDRLTAPSPVIQLACVWFPFNCLVLHNSVSLHPELLPTTLLNDVIAEEPSMGAFQTPVAFFQRLPKFDVLLLQSVLPILPKEDSSSLTIHDSTVTTSQASSMSLA